MTIGVGAWLAVLALQTATPVPPSAAPSVQEADTRKVIWGKLRAGMTKKEAKLLHPQNLVPLGNGCHIVAYPRFDKTGLIRVDMEWSVKDAAALRCGEQVRRTLIAKYGEPDKAGEDTEVTDCGNPYAGGFAGAAAQLCRASGGEDPKHFTYARWVREGVEISFKMDSEADDPMWWAVYRPELVAAEGMKAAF